MGLNLLEPAGIFWLYSPLGSICTTPKNREPLLLLLLQLLCHTLLCISNLCKLKQRKLNCELVSIVVGLMHVSTSKKCCSPPKKNASIDPR